MAHALVYVRTLREWVYAGMSEKKRAPLPSILVKSNTYTVVFASFFKPPLLDQVFKPFKVEEY